MIGWWGRRPSLRTAGLVAGSLAALVMMVVGCETVTQGTSKIDRADAPMYRASVSLSKQNSASSSSSRESERLVTSSREALHTACEALSSSSVDAVDAVNGFVRAHNDQTADATAKKGPAIDALNRTADLVAGTVSATLSPQLVGALNDYVAAARAVSAAIADNSPVSVFNAATNRMNDVKRSALKLCDAGY